MNEGPPPLPAAGEASMEAGPPPLPEAADAGPPPLPEAAGPPPLPPMTPPPTPPPVLVERVSMQQASPAQQRPATPDQPPPVQSPGLRERRAAPADAPPRSPAVSRRRRREDSAALRLAARQAAEASAPLAQFKLPELSQLSRRAVVAAAVGVVTLIAVLYSLAQMNLSRSLATTLMSHKISYRQDSFQRCPHAMAWLNSCRGIMYVNGYAPGGKNISRAVGHFRRAANAGDPNAGTALGILYYQGRNVTKDVKGAMRWFEHSAHLGEVRAMSVLCYLHYKGHVDATMDFLTAAKWSDQATQSASFNLGVMIAHGQGEEQDYKEAYKWISLSMGELRDRAIDARNSLVVRMSLEEVEEAAELVKEWKDSIRNKKRARVTSALASMLPSFAKRGATAGASLKSLPAAT